MVNEGLLSVKDKINNNKLYEVKLQRRWGPAARGQSGKILYSRGVVRVVMTISTGERKSGG